MILTSPTVTPLKLEHAAAAHSAPMIRFECRRFDASNNTGRRPVIEYGAAQIFAARQIQGRYAVLNMTLSGGAWAHGLPPFDAAMMERTSAWRTVRIMMLIFTSLRYF